MTNNNDFKVRPLLSLFVACFNEEDNIANTLTNVRDACVKTGITYEVLVIDDASRDRSVEVIREWMTRNPSVPLQLIENQVNRGLAANFMTAARQAGGEWYRLICGDDVEPASTLTAIFSELGRAEVLLPYHTHVAGKEMGRKLLSKSYTFLINMLSGHSVRYYNGLPVARRCHAEKFCRPELGFAFQADYVTKLLDQGLSKLEIPVTTNERVNGSASALTKKNFKGAWRAMRSIARRRAERMLGIARSDRSATNNNTPKNTVLEL